MDKKVVGYWILTVLTALSIGAGGVMDVMGGKDIADGMAHLGFPAYAATIIGVWKLAGVIVVLAPKLARLKEWAYAGIVVDLVSASACHAFTGDPAGNVITPRVITLIVLGSWFLRPQSRRLEGALI